MIENIQSICVNTAYVCAAGVGAVVVACGVARGMKLLSGGVKCVTALGLAGSLVFGGMVVTSVHLAAAKTNETQQVGGGLSNTNVLGQVDGGINVLKGVVQGRVRSPSAPQREANGESNVPALRRSQSLRTTGMSPITDDDIALGWRVVSVSSNSVDSSVFAFSHTDAEKCDFIKGRLERVLEMGSDIPGLMIETNNVTSLTWTGFLGHESANGWTFAEKKDAFACYLSAFGTNDCRNLPEHEKRLVMVALRQCDILKFTDAAESLKKLALNPDGICRHVAIEKFLKLSPVEDELTRFVEMVMTNTVAFSERERGAACGIFAQVLLEDEREHAVQQEIKNRAVKMLYRNRFLSLSGMKIFDELFTSHIEGYILSSNRLELANYVLGHPSCSRLNRRDFTAITNQLLSSGRPLQQLNLEGNEQ